MRTTSFEKTYFVIWIHDNNLPTDVEQQVRTRLSRSFYYIRIFSELDPFYRYIHTTKFITSTLLIISHSTKYQSLFQMVHKDKNKKFNGVHVFLPSTWRKSTLHQSTKIITDVGELFDELSKNILLYHPDIHSEKEKSETILLENMRAEKFILPPVGIFYHKYASSNSIRCFENHSDGPDLLRFLSFLCMLEIIVKTEHGRHDLSDMFMVFRSHYKDNPCQMKKIDALEESHQRERTIEHYTSEDFLFRLTSKAFRSECIREVHKFRVFISDLCKELLKKASSNQTNAPYEVYRGKMMPNNILQKLMDNEGKIISINGFLSTSRSSDVANAFASIGQPRPGHTSVLFILHIDDNITQPYADISGTSINSDEEEVLFAPCTLWMIQSVKQTSGGYLIEMVPHKPSDQKPEDLHKQFMNEKCLLLSLGDILESLGDNKEAEEFYHQALELPDLPPEIITELNYKIAMLRSGEHDSWIALRYLKDALVSCTSSTTLSNQEQLSLLLYQHSEAPTLIVVYNNMGMLHHQQGNIDDAMKYYEEALKYKASCEELAVTHNNMGTLLFLKGEYELSCQHHREALTHINEQSEWRKEFQKNLELVEQHITSLEKTTHGTGLSQLEGAAD